VTRKLYSALTVISLVLLSACSAGGPRTNLSDIDDNLNGLNENPLTGVDPTLNLFDTPVGSDTNTTGTPTNIDQPPTTTTTTLPPADATASACMSTNGYLGNGGAQQQWACLNQQAASGTIGQDAVMGMASATVQMMLACSTSVRQELIQIINQSDVSKPAVVAQIFETAKTKMTQCYYRIVNLQRTSVQWSPYQAAALDLNAGNLWNLQQTF
jgi:hypothetical protein